MDEGGTCSEKWGMKIVNLEVKVKKYFRFNAKNFDVLSNLILIGGSRHRKYKIGGLIGIM